MTKNLIAITEEDFQKISYGYVMDLFKRSTAAGSDPEKVTAILHEIEWFNNMLATAVHSSATTAST